MFIPSIISDTTVTFFVNGVPYSVDKSFHGYTTVVSELKSATPNVEKLIAATQPVQAIVQAVAKAEAATGVDYLAKGTVSVTKSEVRYNGEVVTGVLVDRILALLAEGFDIMPMVRFLENLYQNPADFAREELYLWLENNNLPITEDGHFLAYKTVNSDYTSHHDGKTDNTPGKVVSMPRQSVDPVRDHTCSRGLHFCSHSYLGSYGGGGVIVMLKINPADVVSIPSDYNNAKGRAWKYLVLSKFGEDPHTKEWPSVVSPTGEAYTPVDDNDDEADPDEDFLDVTSDLGKALFAACNEINLTDRQRRLTWASRTLDDYVPSFDGLTIGEASKLLEVARTKKAEADQVAEAHAALAKSQAASAANAARQVEAAAIRGYGIETLRRQASAAGFSKATGKSPYKDAVKTELVAFLISKIGQ